MPGQNNCCNRGLISSIPIPYCAKTLYYMDSIHGLPRFCRYNSSLVVTWGPSCFTRAFSCSKKITGE